MARFWVFLCGFAWLLAACESSEERLRSDARAFLGRNAAVDYRSSEAEREKRVAALERLVLTDPTVIHTRDLCVSGHREMARQHRAQEANAGEIDRAIAGKTDGSPLDAATVARLQEKLAESEHGLERAREQLRTCEEQARSLSLRFAPR
jgi:hypothetical protein